MRILIYKRTHTGDPDITGLFGVNGCMGSVRGFEYDAVIGVGGIGSEARSYGIDGRITWVGVGPTKEWAKPGTDPRGPIVRFDKFRIWDASGPHLHGLAPMLARRIYERRARYILGSLSSVEQQEAEEVLKLIEEPRGGHGPAPGRGRTCTPAQKSQVCPPRRRSGC